MARGIVVTFVSRRNSLRSRLAHASLAHLGGSRFTVLSCGQPGKIAGGIHPAAVAALDNAGIPQLDAPPRSWNDLTASGAPRAEFVITLDESTSLAQPRWPGQPDAALWAFPDIAEIENPEDAVRAAIQMMFVLRRRLELFVSLPLQGADRAAIRSDLRDLAHMR
ncbi:protein tyrosine phosphatase [Variovorax sp. ZS18.2.2]|uniref:protein tyrosine phosphatase n=1 Tax=Variovorax sp. ZS18.2.2 TaxID=2971255 RepID=UPI002151E05C|nr:protein tyrosine phosphatase [Variovorax sp. ZS18.2.2]MCR6477262.1 protein tyrosine phosphatase [Variovorax sp. ZS18.2.2]